MTLCGVVFLVFLFGKIFDWGPIGEWSWWLVFLPLIIEFVVDILWLTFMVGAMGKASSRVGLSGRRVGRRR